MMTLKIVTLYADPGLLEGYYAKFTNAPYEATIGVLKRCFHGG